MKFGNILRVVNPEYVYLRLTPNNSIRNNGTDKIAKAVASLYRNVAANIRKDRAKLIRILGREFMFGTKYSAHAPAKVAYYVYIEKKKAEFYFVIPRQYASVIREKMTQTWSGVTVKEVATLPVFGEDSTKYQLVYTYEDGLSLNTDRRDNDLLRANLNVIDVMEDGDRAGIFYNIVPVSQHSWRATYRNTLDKVKKGAPVDRNKVGFSYVFKSLISAVSSFANMLGEAVTDKKHVSHDRKPADIIESIAERMSGQRRVSDATTKKAADTILDTQIVVMSESADPLRQRNNARSLAQSFDVISEDNALRPKRFKGVIDPLKLRINGVEVNKVSSAEASNFIALPGRELLDQYGFIERIDTKETPVPEELRRGVMCIGENTYRGNKQRAYLTDHREYKYLSLFLIGPTRSGKTTLIGNLTRDAINNGECVILIDYIENCEMSTQVAELFPPDKVLNIVCDDIDTAQGLGYNEVRYDPDPEKQYVNAKQQTTQLTTLINSINTEDTPLSARMNRFLTSAALVVFLSGGSIRDVFAVLQNHDVRHRFISKVPNSQSERMAEYVGYLHELDEKEKGSGDVIGSKLNLVEGIISRLNKLKDNPHMEMMLKKGTEDNVDLVEEMEKNQLICIKMPEDMFNTDNERDVYTTYWTTKIWLALQLRAKRIPDKDKRKKVNLFIDEISQVQNTEEFLSERLTRLAKYRLKPIVSCHYLDQLRHMRKTLSGANASYVLISGCDKKNFAELAEELRPFELDDILRLPEHHAMNLVKTKSGYARFISKLPPPVDEKKTIKLAGKPAKLTKRSDHHEQRNGDYEGRKGSEIMDGIQSGADDLLPESVGGE